MPIIHLEDLDDPRLAAYSGMTDAQLRDCPDSTHGLFIGESRKVIERALAAGVRMRSLFMEEKWLDQTMPLVDSLLADDPDFPVLVATREQFRALTGYEVTRGALAAFERPPLPRVEDLLASARRVAVLEDVTNYTNIGAVFRSAAALGIDAVLDAVGFDGLLPGTDVVFTGEGKIDSQRARGKVVSGVCGRAKRAGVPVIAVVGQIGSGFEPMYDQGLSAVFSVNRAAQPFSESRHHARENLALAMENIARTLALRPGNV